MTTLEPGASEVLTHGLEARPRSTALRASSPAASITDGLEVLVQEVMAAMTTCPWSRSKRVPSSRVTGTRLLGRPLAPVGSGSNQPAGSGSWFSCGAVPGHGGRRVAGRERLGRGLVRPVRPLRRLGGGGGGHVGQGGPEAAAGVGQGDPVLGPAGAGQAGHDRAQVQLDRLGVAGLGLRVVPQALLLGVRLDQGDQLGRAAGEARGSGGSRRRSGRWRRSTRTRATCCRWWPGSRPARCRPRGRRTRRTCPPPRGRAAARSRSGPGRWRSSPRAARPTA